MKHESESINNWDKYRSLLDETSRLEYEIIAIHTTALCRKEGNGEPDAREREQIFALKSLLLPKLAELKAMQAEISPIIRSERAETLRSQAH